MAIKLEDILNSICTEVALSHENEHQKVYSVATPLESKLAYEVLTVFGLDVKVYHQADKPSKLYVTHPNIAPAQLEKVYGGALAYAKTLKQIKLSLESMCEENVAVLSAVDYNIAFLKGQGRSKQILVQIMPSEDARALAAAPGSAEAPAILAASAAASVNAPARATTRKYGEKPKTHYEELSSGPAVGRGNYPGKLSAEGEAQQNSLRRRMGLTIFSNMTASSFVTFIMAIIAGILFSVFVMMKGFLCPDLAVANKNKAWYCGSTHDEPEPTNKQPTSFLAQPPAPR